MKFVPIPTCSHSLREHKEGLGRSVNLSNYQKIKALISDPAIAWNSVILQDSHLFSWGGGMIHSHISGVLFLQMNQVITAVNSPAWNQLISFWKHKDKPLLITFQNNRPVLLYKPLNAKHVKVILFLVSRIALLYTLNNFKSSKKQLSD